MKQDRNGVRTAQDLERKYDFDSIYTLKRNYELQKNGLTKVENEMNNFVSSVTKNIKELQDQVDGNITTWFSNGVPTIENYPAVEWEAIDEKNNHLGDLYYDKETGYAYRYTLENEEYSWIKITDVDITKALAIANSAQDTADSKRRVFVIRPSPPYDVGDLWLKDEELYRCQTTKADGETFEDNDWIKATKYTDDTYAVQVGKDLTILSGTVTEIKDGVDEISQKITHTTELVDSQGNQIGTLSKEVSEIIQNLDEILLKLSGVFKNFDTVSGLGNLEILSKINTTYFELKIINACQSFPNKKEFPNKKTFPKGSYLRVTYGDGSYSRYKLPPLALRVLDDVYDEMNINSNKITVIKRIGIDETGKLYALNKEETKTYDDIEVQLKEGKNIISLESFPDASLEIKYMLSNIYTDAFATKIELSSSISVLKEAIRLAVEGKISEVEAKSLIEVAVGNITSEVSKKVDNTTFETRMTQTTNSFNVELSEKVNNTDYNKAQILLKLSDGKSSSLINADLIDLKANNILNLLAGSEINLSSNNISITADNFTLYKDGKMWLKDNSDDNDPFFLITSKDNSEKTHLLSSGMIISNSSNSKISNYYLGQIDMINGDLDCETIYADTNVAMRKGKKYLYLSADEGLNQHDSMSQSILTSSYIDVPEIRNGSLATLKKNFEKLEDGLNIILNTDIYKYHLKFQEDKEKKHIGLVIGDNYNYSKEITSNDNKSVDLYSMIAASYRAIQQQQIQIEKLEEKIKKLEEENEKIY